MTHAVIWYLIELCIYENERKDNKKIQKKKIFKNKRNKVNDKLNLILRSNSKNNVLIY